MAGYWKRLLEQADSYGNGTESPVVEKTPDLQETAHPDLPSVAEADDNIQPIQQLTTPETLEPIPVAHPVPANPLMEEKVNQIKREELLKNYLSSIQEQRREAEKSRRLAALMEGVTQLGTGLAGARNYKPGGFDFMKKAAPKDNMLDYIKAMYPSVGNRGLTYGQKLALQKDRYARLAELEGLKRTGKLTFDQQQELEKLKHSNKMLEIYGRGYSKVSTARKLGKDLTGDLTKIETKIRGQKELADLKAKAAKELAILRNDNRMQIEDKKAARQAEIDTRRRLLQDQKLQIAERQYRQKLVDTQRKIADEESKEPRDQLNSLLNIKILTQQAEKRGEQFVAALGINLAKFLGERGRLTDQDVVRYLRPAGLLEKAKYLVRVGLTGKIPKSSRDTLMRMYQVLEKAYRYKVEKAYMRAAHRFVKDWKSYGKDISLEDAYNAIDPAGSSSSEALKYHKRLNKQVEAFMKKNRINDPNEAVKILKGLQGPSGPILPEEFVYVR